MCEFNRKPWRPIIHHPIRMWKLFREHQAVDGDCLVSPYMHEIQPIETWLDANATESAKRMVRIFGEEHALATYGGFGVWRFKFPARLYAGEWYNDLILLPVLVQGRVYGADWRGMRIEKMFIPRPPASLVPLADPPAEPAPSQT